MRKKLFSVLLAIGLVFSFVPAQAVHAEPAADSLDSSAVIHITSFDDFKKFAENCCRDDWSYKKSFVLDNDIAFTDYELVMASAFAGTFDGNGHSIKNVKMYGIAGNTGVFGVVYASGTVKNLHVSGTLEPNGVMSRIGGIAGANHGLIENCEFEGKVSADSEVGGICGCNFSDGTISSCKVSGTVEGKSSVGGIAGVNDGKILSCTNEAMVNTTFEERALTNDQISNIIEKIRMSENYNVLKTLFDRIDAGGIAGVSAGSIEDSVNNGSVGYQHVGYNMGGIVGRTLGLVRNCTNNGTVYGRADVGGIVGQQQPYILLDATGSDLSKLKTQLDDLNKLVDDALSDVAGTSAKTRNQLLKISATIDKTEGHLKAITDSIGSGVKDVLDDDEEETSDIELPEDITDIIPDDPEKVIDDASETLDDISNALSDMNARVSKIREDIGREGSEMYASVDLLIRQIDETTGVLDTGIQGSINKLRSINNKGGEIFDQIQGMVKKVSSISDLISEPYEDTSAVDVENTVKGRTTGSKNFGLITADSNVGGVVGNASFEIDFDVKKTIERRGQSPFESVMKTKCVVDHCINRGEIVCNQESGGGILGSQAHGIVTDCEGYGKLTVKGNYAGGVVGYSTAEIRNCYSKLDMYGTRYVGGIAGFAKKLHDCIAMADIVEASQFIGAIAGNVDEVDSKRIYQNLYYSQSWHGIDGIGYSGIAEAKSYDELVALNRLPESFYNMTLTFEADGKVIKTLTCRYGEAIASGNIPEVPNKDGFRGVWSRTDFSNIVEDEVVKAYYIRINTLLASNLNRNGRSLMLTVGNFRPEDTLIIAEDKAQQFMADYKYHVRIPDDGNASHELRYQPANTGLSVYYWLGDDTGFFTMKKAGSFGKYATFDVTGNDIDILVMEIDEPLVNFVIFLFFAIPIAIALIIVIIVVRVVRKKKKAEAKK